VTSLPAVAYIGVGSNIEPEENVRKALALLTETPGITLTGISTFYRTAPLPDPDESTSLPTDTPKDFDPDFLNGVLSIRTLLSSSELLARFAEIEHALGRKRPGNRYAPRTMDLDLLLYGREEDTAASPEWEKIGPNEFMAHSDIERRAFVALPLFELSPDLILPPHRVPLRAFAASFGTPGGTPEDAFSEQLRSLFLSS
jgi:2-amino-4-hydroxy-6-hydroxymethyldihydropteridine diphosphokinase